MKRAVSLTLHAQQKMLERGIEKVWVERVALDPEWVEPEPRHSGAERRFAAVHAFGGRYLRVVCIETPEAIRVITATLDRGARKRL